MNVGIHFIFSLFYSLQPRIDKPKVKKQYFESFPTCRERNNCFRLNHEMMDVWHVLTSIYYGLMAVNIVLGDERHQSSFHQTEKRAIYTCRSFWHISLTRQWRYRVTQFDSDIHDTRSVNSKMFFRCRKVLGGGSSRSRSRAVTTQWRTGSYVTVTYFETLVTFNEGWESSRAQKRNCFVY